jgi:hypothetical protein
MSERAGNRGFPHRGELDAIALLQCISLPPDPTGTTSAGIIPSLNAFKRGELIINTRAVNSSSIRDLLMRHQFRLIYRSCHLRYHVSHAAKSRSTGQLAVKVLSELGR